METLSCVVDTQQGLCVHNTQLHICFLLELQIRDDYLVIFLHTHIHTPHGRLLVSLSLSLSVSVRRTLKSGLSLDVVQALGLNSKGDQV